MRPRASRPDALQSVTVLETLKGLAVQHGASGVPFKDLELATRSRLDYRALTDALNALVTEGSVRRVTDKPASRSPRPDASGSINTSPEFAARVRGQLCTGTTKQVQKRCSELPSA